MEERQRKVINDFLEAKSKEDSKLLTRALPWLSVVFMFSVLAFAAWPGVMAKLEGVDYPVVRTSRSVYALVAIAIVQFWVLHRRISRTAALSNWILHALMLPREASSSDSAMSGEGKKWPWGNHHTELLGHLEAAAMHFWTLYEPDEPDTAPTNEMVANWLREHRHVSREKAQAIASILRADGLKTGPRRWS